MMGYKFRRQLPIEPFIVDFACIELKLIVEIDGSQHVERAAQDRARTRRLEGLGYRVVRFWNNDVLQRTDSVLEMLSRVISEREREIGGR